MFSTSAAIYDPFYASLYDFAAQADHLRALIGRDAGADPVTLLDVACGTGTYLAHLREHLAVEGLDLDSAMLAIAREKLPDIPLHHADMTDFDLGRRFDVVSCLGSSIGYVRTLDLLDRTIANLARHTAPDGLVIVEPWFSPDVWQPGRVGALVVDVPNGKVARVSTGDVGGRTSILMFHYLVGMPDGINHLTERHEMGLFTDAEYLTAFARAGLLAHHDPVGLTGRGLFLGRLA